MDVAERAAGLVGEGLGRGGRPLVLGGDHSLSIGTAAAVARHYGKDGGAIGIVWVDAHADMNTPRRRPAATSTA